MKSGCWLDDVIRALSMLDGQGSLQEIYSKIEEIRDVSSLKNWNLAVRMNLELYPSDSEAFIGGEDIFYAVNGLGKGR